MDESVARGRDAFDRRAWGRAYDELSGAVEPLDIEDLERLAAAAYLVGRPEESFDAWTQAHQECARIGEVARAARCAFWLAFALLNRGDTPRGSGWVDRAQRLLDQRNLDCVERGYLTYAAGLRAVLSGDAAGAHGQFASAARTGELFRDVELTALARIGEGRCCIYLNRGAEGLALLDEAMAAVAAKEVSAIAVGDAYCTVIEGCQELFDVRRAELWTAALSTWCAAQPELVLYRGQCLVHRAEILLLRGAWSEAAAELAQARARLAEQAHPALADAAYLQGELHRLRGEYLEAEQAYREANELGRRPQPGLALLRLAQGQLEAADAAMRRVLRETDDRIGRARVLGAYVEVGLATGDVAAARAAADELTALSDELGQPYLQALGSYAQGTVELAHGSADDALPHLRRAWEAWRGLEAPYEQARVRMALSDACQVVGDVDGAALEHAAARSGFLALGAAECLEQPANHSGEGGLTARELEVLALLATGLTNREIAAQLVMSEKTAASHLNHMFTKLGVRSRAAAVAYAYDHGLTKSRASVPGKLPT